MNMKYYRVTTTDGRQFVVYASDEGEAMACVFFTYRYLPEEMVSVCVDVPAIKARIRSRWARRIIFKFNKTIFQ